MTPPLGRIDYVFPVVGRVFYADTYGAPRLPDRWHHGDDIFAPLGALVVAVADGWLGGVGWDRLGGWGLWLHDGGGNTFYYAHLSGYTPLALQAAQVEAGQVLGFVGDTGDAIRSPFHLHFEVHPASLLYLGNEGAVNPTGYLEHWRHLAQVRPVRPVLPSLPAGAFGDQANRVFRQLLSVAALNPKPARRRTVSSSHRGSQVTKPRSRAQEPSGGVGPQAPRPLVVPQPPTLVAGVTGTIRSRRAAGAQAQMAGVRGNAQFPTLSFAGLALAGLGAASVIWALVSVRRSGLRRWRSLFVVLRR